MPRALKIIGIAACVGLAACTGRIEDPSHQPNGDGPGAPGSNANRPTDEPGNPSSPSGPGAQDSPNQPAAPRVCEATARPVDVPLRRMNAAQYRSTIRDLFGGVVAPSASFPETTRGLGYSTLAEANVVTQLGTEELLEAAEDVAESLIRNLTRILPCARQSNEACALTFIDTYGRKAFRRPLRTEERSTFLSLFRQVRADTPFPESIGLVAEAMLQSPQFLYFVEEGSDADPTRRLTGFEIATRLAYLFTGTTPDEALLLAAEAGALDDTAGIELEARRLLDDPRASGAIAAFFREWLEVSELGEATKDRALFPEWSGTLAASMVEEIDRFVGYVMEERGGSIDALLTSSETFVNAPLAELYGIEEVVSTGPRDWQRVTLPSAQRAGLLTKAGFLAAKAYESTTSPIHRGKFIRTQLLCDALPPPPPDVQSMVPEYPADATQREKSEILMNHSTCGNCHRMMNPIGLAFENYDALGKWQSEEQNGAPIDARGEIVGSTLQPFVGAVELGHSLAATDEVRSCITRHVFRYTFGKNDAAGDACAIDGIAGAFEGGGIGDLLVALARSDAFAHRSGGME